MIFQINIGILAGNGLLAPDTHISCRIFSWFWRQTFEWVESCHVITWENIIYIFIYRETVCIYIYIYIVSVYPVYKRYKRYKISNRYNSYNRYSRYSIYIYIYIYIIYIYKDSIWYYPKHHLFATFGGWCQDSLQVLKILAAMQTPWETWEKVVALQNCHKVSLYVKSWGLKREL